MTGAKPGADNSGRLIWLAGWALAALILIVGSGAAALHQDFSEPDNAMRLVRVRDFLAGQSWFDPVQHRLNPPDGTAMHWARWLDGAIAAPIGLLTPLIGQTPAEIATAFLWPLGLLGLFVMLMVEVSGRIGAPDRLTAVQKAFMEHDAQQCGFCTPGFVTAATAFVREHPNASIEQVRAGLGGNLCRCGTYAGMLLAVADASKKGAA